MNSTVPVPLESPYGYIPSKAAGLVFTTLFAVLALVHLAQVIRCRTWWLLVLPIGAATELIGWIGRDMSSSNPLSSSGFFMQICCLTIAPTFFSAACYGIFSSITRLAPYNNFLKPKTLTTLFVTVDFFCLVLQAGGGGLAATAKAATGSALGTHIMLAGIVLQLSAMIVFSCAAIQWTVMSKPELNAQVIKQSSKVMLALLGIALASFAIILRGCYRAPELAQGWKGYLITHEPYFLWLDAAAMVFCLVSLAVFHPSWTVPHFDMASTPSYELSTSSLRVNESKV